MEAKMEDFMRLNIVIGKIVEIEKLPESKKLFKIRADIGIRNIQLIAGGAEFYRPEDLKGKLVVVLSNLESKIIRGFKSEGMLLAADFKGKPVWLTIEEEVPLGTKVR